MRSWKQIPQPKISIVICNYNYQDFVLGTINSCLSQTYAAHQILIIDDGSTDRSVEFIKEKHSDLRLISKENEGQISAYNEGFKHVTGDVVLFLDSDDELLPNALELVSNKYLDDVVKVQFKMRVIDKDGVDLDTILPSHLDEGDCGKSLIESGVLYKSPPASGNTYRVDALKSIFPLPTSPEEKHGADYFCIYGICMLGLIASISEPLFRYRIHESGQSIGNSLGFGNAVKKHDRQKVMLRRWNMLTQWLCNRLGEGYIFKPLYLDFTQQKLFYSQDILNSSSISQKVELLRKHIPWLTKSIWVRQDFSFPKKFILLVWMMILPLLPKKLAGIAAKKVCNPT